jgi:hypothetical protein
MVDLGQKKADTCLPFFMPQSFGVASNQNLYSKYFLRAVLFSFSHSFAFFPKYATGWRLFETPTVNTNA